MSSIATNCALYSRARQVTIVTVLSVTPVIRISRLLPSTKCDVSADLRTSEWREKCKMLIAHKHYENLASAVWGHPFMTFTRREERGHAQVDAWGRGGSQTHVNVHTEN